MDVFNSFKTCPNNLFFADIFTCRCKQLAIYLVTFISVSTLNIYWPERNADLRCFSYFLNNIRVADMYFVHHYTHALYAQRRHTCFEVLRVEKM